MIHKNSPGPVQVDVAGPAAFDSLVSSSDTNPCSARGAGSTPLLVKRSASDAKHLRAPSATCKAQTQTYCTTKFLASKYFCFYFD
jgi:hypothetical protein